MSFACRIFLSPIIPITLVSLFLSACGSIDAGQDARSFKRGIQVSSLEKIDDAERRGLPTLDLQMAWREQAMASNLSFNPKLRPDHVPKNFTQEPWSRELPLLDPKVEGILTSDFGWRRLYGKRDFHSGIDIAAPTGTVVFTPVPGKVLYVKHAGTDSGIVINDGERQHTFWHTKPWRGLKEGDWLKKGHSVGTLVEWGSRTHLHYSVHLTGPSDTHKARNDGNAIDPLTLIRRLKKGIVIASRTQVKRSGNKPLTPNALLMEAAWQPVPSKLALNTPSLDYRLETVLPD